jgi:uncharacterized membrane protein
MDVLRSPLAVAIPAAAVALAASLLLVARGFGKRLPGCSPGSGCDQVATSRWAKIGSIPVAVPGAVVYAVMLASAVASAIRPAPLPLALLIASTTAAALVAMWFVFIQLLVIRRACVYCMIAQAAALIAGAVLIHHAWDHPNAALVGVAAAGGFLLAQLLIAPKMHRFEPSPAPAPLLVPPETPVSERSEEPDLTVQPPAPPPPPAPTTATPAPPAAHAPRPPRQVALLGGRLRFDANLFPVLGSPDANHLIADVMDYTCEHCRSFHPMLEAALRAMNGEVGVIVIPAPLERACNRFVPADDPRYANACTYARLALAVAQQGGLEPFAAFHRWLLEGSAVPSVDAARQKAAGLIGAPPADDAPAVRAQLNDAVEIYRLTGTGPSPRLLLPTGILWGQVSSPQKLVDLLRQQLPAPSPPAAPAAPPTPARSVFHG